MTTQGTSTFPSTSDVCHRTEGCRVHLGDTVVTVEFTAGAKGYEYTSRGVQHADPADCDSGGEAHHRQVIRRHIARTSGHEPGCATDDGIACDCRG